MADLLSELIDKALKQGQKDNTKLKIIAMRAKHLNAEQLYEEGRMSKGISVRYLMRHHLLMHEIGIDVPQALVDEALAYFSMEDATAPPPPIKEKAPWEN